MAEKKHFLIEKAKGKKFFYLGVQHLLLALTYTIIKPISPSREIKIVRGTWIFFGTLVGLRWILNLSHMIFWMNFFHVLEEYYQLVSFHEFLEFLAFTGLALVVARYPEALLITEYQVTKAAKLYQFIDDYESTSRLPHLISTQKHLMDYIQSISPDLKLNIKKQN